MATFESTATISGSPEEVWAYAADILRHPEWMSVADAHLLRGDGREVGARGRERLVLGPIAWDIAFEVIEAIPGRRVVWRSIDDPRLDLTVGLDLEPAGPGSTTARYRSEVHLRGRWRLLAPFVSMEGRAGVRRELERLKENVERRTAMPAAT